MSKLQLFTQASDKSEIRKYYDELYRTGHVRNPAVILYDHIRIEKIRSFVQNSQGVILIVGVGSNLDRDLFSNREKVYLFDLSYIAINSITSDTLNAFTADALNIPLPSKSIDLIICSEVLEHIPEIRRVIFEFERLLTPSGTLIISSPNWLSWFGVARFLGEKIFQRPFHSSGQPYDDWKTYWKFKKELSPWFKPVAARGVWYLPPFHYGNRGLSAKWVNRIYFFARPFENLFSLILPQFGHLIVIKCSRT